MANGARSRAHSFNATCRPHCTVVAVADHGRPLDCPARVRAGPGQTARWPADLTIMYAPHIYYMCRTSKLRLARYSVGMDRDRGIDKRLPLRRVEFHILLSLTAGERHGYGIIQDIEARGEASVPDVGTMYRALARLVEAGLIEAVARPPAPDTDAERRNYYRITSAGLSVARAEARRLEALTQAARLGGLLPKGVR